MRYWDNDKDRMFDEAIDELIREQRELNEQAQRAYEMQNISNPQLLRGAI